MNAYLKVSSSSKRRKTIYAQWPTYTDLCLYFVRQQTVETYLYCIF